MSSRLDNSYQRYEQITFEKVRSCCDICGSSQLTSIVKWEGFPLTELYPPRDISTDEGWGRADLVLDFCEVCSHMQLKNVLDQDLLYGHTSDYAFRSSSSKSAIKSYQYFLDVVYKCIGTTNLGRVLEVGCNDLFMVTNAAQSFESYVGIDPVLSRLALPELPANCEVIPDFLENAKLEHIPDIVICKDVLEHVVDPALFIEKLLEKGSKDTLFVVQVTLGETLCQGRRFDQVFHQHLNYFSLHSFGYLLNKLECSLIDYDINFHHWGVGIFLFKKGQPKPLPQKLSGIQIERALRMFEWRMQLADDAIRQNSLEGDVYLFGAGLMLSVYGYHIPSLNKCVRAIIDDQPEKQKSKCLHLPLPIISKNDVVNIDTSTIVLGAVSSRDNVLSMVSKAVQWCPRRIINPVYEI